MKRTILILLALLVTASLATSCFKEDYSKCPGTMTLSFVLEDVYSLGDFDSDIGNDVELQIFKDGIFYESIIIPYDEIKQGSPYDYKKTFEGRIDMVAYAVPPTHSAQWPTPTPNGLHTDQTISMEVHPSVSGHASYESSLYLGRVSTDEAYSAMSDHRIAMTPCFANVTVIIMEPTLFAPDPGTVHIGIEGTAGELRVHDKSTANAIEVISDVAADGDTYTTGMLRLLPGTTPEQSMRINIYKDNALAMYFNVEDVSIAGKEIVIKIYPHNLMAEITVNGWTYKVQAVTP